jgi:hypothetical protein
MTYTVRSAFSAWTSCGFSDGRSSILFLLNGLAASRKLDRTFREWLHACRPVFTLSVRTGRLAIHGGSGMKNALLGEYPATDGVVICACAWPYARRIRRMADRPADLPKRCLGNRSCSLLRRPAKRNPISRLPLLIRISAEANSLKRAEVRKGERGGNNSR